MAKYLLPLLRELADGAFHSGDELGRSLGVSRASIWKLSKKVSALGLELHSVRGKGYRLDQRLDLLDRKVLLGGLSASQREKISELELKLTVDSTNTYALRRAQKGELDLANGRAFVCLAEQQTAGKGRRGREWLSPFGSNVCLTMVREFELGAAGLEGLSLVVGLALVRALRQIGALDLGVKWPNDVLWKNKKLAGILLEMTGDVSGVCQVVIGIGLNVRVDPLGMDGVNQPWTDLSNICPSLPSRSHLVVRVLGELMGVLTEFEECGFAGFMDEWNERDALKGLPVDLISSSGSIRGVASGVNSSGALLLATSDGLQSFYGGEVSLRKANIA